MSDYRELAKAYIKNGYSVIPVNSQKMPSIPEWGKYQISLMTDTEVEKYFKDSWGIALLAGTSKSITFLDFDLKYSLRSDFFETFKQLIPAELLKKMYVQTTKNGGYHFCFSCTKIEGNQKLASRYTTPYEKHEAYLEAFNNPKTRDKALKMALNTSQLILLESRGKGGYCVMSPSPGYEHVWGKIQEITPEEYDILFNAARSLNEVLEVKKDIRLDKYTEWEVSPFNDFNERGDVLSLLFESGWEECKASYNKSIRLRRAGAVTSASSALFDPSTRLFNCFSTSTNFDINRSYSPVDVFLELEAGGDLGVAFKLLAERGFGKEKENI